MNYRDEAFSIFKQWNVEVETQTRKKLKYLRYDKGSEPLVAASVARAINLNVLCARQTFYVKALLTMIP